MPVAIARQNARSNSRRSAGAPGDFIGERPVNSFIHPAGRPIVTSNIKVLRRPVESGQFTSWGFSELIRTRHLVGSMGTVGDCYDNAPMESFWGSMQIELLNRKKWRTKIELSIAMAEWIEHFYNPERLHSSLGYLPPVEFEELHTTANQA
jgi:putative transposase